MNTKLVLAVVAGVVVVGAGAFIAINGATKSALTDEGSEQQATQPAQAGAFQGSFADLAARGGDWKCTVDAQASTGAGQALSSGVVYVSGRKVRGDFTSTVQGIGRVDSHLMADGTDVYSWTSLYPQGMKTKMAASGDETTETSGQGADANQKYSYHCEPAQADASLFIAPTNVTFRTL